MKSRYDDLSFSKSFSFYPSISAILQYSLATKTFHIALLTLANLCSFLNIKDYDDYENILCREADDRSVS